MASIVFMFAGQGAQYPGMGKELYESSPAARRIFDRAEEIRPGTIDMCFNGPAEELNRTINTQPCLFTMDYACAQAAVEAGIQPDFCAGFSLGEVAAAGFAGIMDFDEAFRFVIRRGEEMQKCAEKLQGAMGAVLCLGAEQVEGICREFPDQAYPVNYNCPGQTVVACRADCFDAIAARVVQEKGRMMRLKVSGAFHTPWMGEAAAALKEYLDGRRLNAPKLPLYANFNAKPYGENAAELLAKQVCNPVRWQQTIENLSGAGVFIELGAGKTLSGLVKKTLPEAQVFKLETPEDIQKIKEAVYAG